MRYKLFIFIAYLLPAFCIAQQAEVKQSVASDFLILEQALQIQQAIDKARSELAAAQECYENLNTPEAMVPKLKEKIVTLPEEIRSNNQRLKKLLQEQITRPEFRVLLQKLGQLYESAAQHLQGQLTMVPDKSHIPQDQRVTLFEDDPKADFIHPKELNLPGYVPLAIKALHLHIMLNSPGNYGNGQFKAYQAELDNIIKNGNKDLFQALRQVLYQHQCTYISLIKSINIIFTQQITVPKLYFRSNELFGVKRIYPNFQLQA